jgi:hypothetical protein
MLQDQFDRVVLFQVLKTSLSNGRIIIVVQSIVTITSIIVVLIFHIFLDVLEIVHSL